MSDKKQARAAAKAETAREKALRPWFKKKRFWILGVIGVSVIASVASQGASNSTSDSEKEVVESTAFPSSEKVEATQTETTVAVEVAAPSNETKSQTNARKKGESYLDTQPFSRQGLIDQLKFEGFSEADATFGVDALDVDWTEQAVKKGQDYLDTQAFSRQGLIEQLKFEGFSEADATNAAANVKVDWNEQAAKKAQDYLDTQAFSRQGLIEQLKFEGFSQAEAEYGTKSAGL